MYVRYAIKEIDAEIIYANLNYVIAKSPRIKVLNK